MDVAPNADDELLAAVAAVRRGNPWTPGTRLTRAQEERLLRNLPASGPGSRGGRKGRGRSAGPGRRRAVDASGEGLGDDFFGIGAEEAGEGAEEQAEEGEKDDEGGGNEEDKVENDEMEVDDEIDVL